MYGHTGSADEYHLERIQPVSTDLYLVSVERRLLQIDRVRSTACEEHHRVAGEPALACEVPVCTGANLFGVSPVPVQICSG